MSRLNMASTRSLGLQAGRMASVRVAQPSEVEEHYLGAEHSWILLEREALSE